MVDINAIGRAAQLVDEKNRINYAIQNFDHGGRIVQMEVGGPQPNMGIVSISTVYMDYPDQMVDSIKQLFARRLAEIQKELDGLGVTGTWEPPT